MYDIRLPSWRKTQIFVIFPSSKIILPIRLLSFHCVHNFLTDNLSTVRRQRMQCVCIQFIKSYNRISTYPETDTQYCML